MDKITEILQKYWGYNNFRPLQREIIESVLAGHDTLALMPTGGGKSITFQVPALIMQGITIVVTPLISLMKDQVDNLFARGIKAVFFHASMTQREKSLAWEKLLNGGAKFLYISPERAGSELFQSEAKNLQIEMIVVDEAHCISQWGYDFRPSYLRLNNLRKIWSNATMLALTATATEKVASDICEKLCFRADMLMLKKSFKRPNIQYIVRNTEEKSIQLLHILQRVSGSAIIYVRNRKTTSEVSNFLNSNNISAKHYHAGLDYKEKEKRQTEWRENKIRVIVATNAFGMGIDKPDVRVVIHLRPPCSLEEYYQEAGRAGRDGKRSYAVLLIDKQDSSILQKKVTESFPDRKNILKIYELISVYMNISIGEGYGKMYEFNKDRFCLVYNLRQKFVDACLRILSHAGYIEYIENPNTRSRVNIIADKEELYSLNSVSSNADIVLLQLLRSYPGLFADYVYINETEIGKNTQLNTQQVYDALLELSRTHILHYIPKKETPMIYWSTSREETKYISIPKSVYETRKQLMQQQINAVKNYYQNDGKCRVRKLLAYFGEITDGDCGTCDTCNSNRKSKYPYKKSTIEQLTDNIVNCIKNSEYGCTHHYLMDMFKYQNNEANQIIRLMVDEGIIKETGGIYKISN